MLPARTGRFLLQSPGQQGLCMSADAGLTGRPGTRARDTLCHTFVQRLVAPHTLKTERTADLAPDKSAPAHKRMYSRYSLRKLQVRPVEFAEGDPQYE